MLASRCPFSTSRALQRVFLSGLVTTTAPTTTSIALATQASRRLTTLSSSSTDPRSRNNARIATPTTPSSSASGCVRSYAKLSKPPVKTQRKVQIADDDIPYQWVRIKQPSADGEGPDELGPPQMTDDVLDNLDPAVWSLVMLAPPPPPRPGEPKAAICKIVNLEEEARRKFNEAQEARKERINTKELEFNWAIAKGDMDHKLNRLREFLRKGMRVEVLLAKKRGSRVATPEEAEQLIQNIRDAVAEVPQAKEVKKLDGTIGRMARLAFEGPGKKMREQIEANEAEAKARARARDEAEAQAQQG